MNKMDLETKKKIDNFLYYNGKKIVVISISVVALTIFAILLTKQIDSNFGMVFFKSGF